MERIILVTFRSRGNLYSFIWVAIMLDAPAHTKTASDLIRKWA